MDGDYDARVRAAHAAGPAERIVRDPAVMTGLASIRGTRVTVSMILGQLAAGHSASEILTACPYLEGADIRAALAFAAQHAK